MSPAIEVLAYRGLHALQKRSFQLPQHSSYAMGKPLQMAFASPLSQELRPAQATAGHLRAPPASTIHPGTLLSGPLTLQMAVLI